MKNTSETDHNDKTSESSNAWFVKTTPVVDLVDNFETRCGHRLTDAQALINER